MNWRKRRTTENSRGAAAIEFALILPVLIMLLFGIIEFGRAYNAKITLANGAREAARSYVISGDQDLFGAIETNLETTLPGVTLVLNNFCSDVDHPHVVAEATANFDYNLPLLYSGSMDLTESVVMRCND